MKPLRERGWRDERDAAAQVAEMATARQQLADDDWHPALCQELGSPGDRTELGEPRFRHDGKHTRVPARRSGTNFILDAGPRLVRSRTLEDRRRDDRSVQGGPM